MDNKVLTEAEYIELLESRKICLYSIPCQARTKRIYLVAVSVDGSNLSCVPIKDMDKEMCKMAVRSSCNAIESVPDGILDDEIIDLSLECNPDSFMFLQDSMKTFKRCILVCREYPYLKAYVPMEYIDKVEFYLCFQDTKKEILLLDETIENLKNENRRLLSKNEFLIKQLSKNNIKI